MWGGSTDSAVQKTTFKTDQTSVVNVPFCVVIEITFNEKEHFSINSKQPSLVEFDS